MSQSAQKVSKGFTLIEIMVAIAIVAVLSTIGLVLYSQTQKAGRDSKRKGDVRTIHNALESLKLATGSYQVPASKKYSCTTTSIPCPTPPGDSSTWTTTLVGNGNGTVYFSGGAAPVDPINALSGGSNYAYSYDLSGNVCAETLENGGGPYCLPAQQTFP